MARKHQRSLASGETILIVDDDSQVRASLRPLLEREGHEVIEASSGTEAVSLCRDRAFDLMLLDYLMPGMTGEEVVLEVRKHHPDLQIVLQTGYANEHPPRETLRRLDIQGYHDKGEGPEKLLLWVDSALKASRHLKTIRKSQEGLLYILKATPEIHRIQPLSDLLHGIFLQLLGFLRATNGFLAVSPPGTEISGFVATVHEDAIAFPVKVGKYQTVSQFRDLPEDDQEAVSTAIRTGQILSSAEQTLVPLIIGNRTLGVVSLDCPPPDANMELIKIFSNQAAVAVENLQLYDAVTHDFLTGVATKNHFLHHLAQTLVLAIRHQHPLSVMMIDMDHFKGLNDTYGHQAGDEAIIQVAQGIKQCLRTTDIVGRFGGDEFMVLLPETPPEGAAIVAERICEYVRTLPFASGGQAIPLTISIGIGGVASFAELESAQGKSNPSFSSLQDTLLRTADEALYETKKQGRDGFSLKAMDLCQRA